MIYLASPYTASEPGLTLHRFRMTEYYTAKYMKLGFPIFSPIVHCHELAAKFGMPTTFSYWWDYNLAFLQKADALWVLTLPGWDKSQGVEAEIKFWNNSVDRGPVLYKEVD